MNRLSEFELRIALLLVLVVIIFILAMTIAIGHVEEKTSYGLTDAIKLFSYLAIGGSTWAFGYYQGKNGGS